MWRLLLTWLLLVLAGCIVLEVTLRLFGYKPGDLRPNWLSFHQVDSLYIIPQFKTLDDGIMVADSLYWSQQSIKINSEGFRGKSFSSFDSTKKKILMIGDSFVWGMSADPIEDSSFCNLLESKLNVFNCGIPATDPLQYSLIAEKYLNALSPDAVYVFVFTGNDLMRFDRKVYPGDQVYYWTNAGAVAADIDGMHFSDPQSAYTYLCNEKYYVKNPKNICLRIIAKSVLLSRLYAVKFRVEEKLQAMRAVRHPDITLKYLLRIYQTCVRKGIDVNFVLIPEVKEVSKNLSATYSTLIRNNTLNNHWILIDFPKDSYLPYPDGHWNNKGHALIAKNILEKELSNKP